MLKKIFTESLRHIAKRNYLKKKWTFKEVMEYKKPKSEKSTTDIWIEEDKKAIKKELKQFQVSKEYEEIQNDWKNNLIKKQKRFERRVESLKNMPEIKIEEPKLILHKYIIIMV